MVAAFLPSPARGAVAARAVLAVQMATRSAWCLASSSRSGWLSPVTGGRRPGGADRRSGYRGGPGWPDRRQAVPGDCRLPVVLRARPGLGRHRPDLGWRPRAARSRDSRPARRVVLVPPQRNRRRTCARRGRAGTGAIPGGRGLGKLVRAEPVRDAIDLALGRGDRGRPTGRPATRASAHSSRCSCTSPAGICLWHCC